MYSQLGLFDSGPRVHVDDRSGKIAYYPALLDGPAAAALFHWLLDHAPWSSETMWMYDKMVDVPRLVARFDGEYPPMLAEAKARVEALLGETFANVALNYYRDGRDSVAWHSDRIEQLRPNPTIALLSLGSTRQMVVRTKAKPRRTYAVDLDPGSLFVMAGASQEHWEHTIPKSSRPSDARISIAFRPYRG